MRAQEGVCAARESLLLSFGIYWEQVEWGAGLVAIGVTVTMGLGLVRFMGSVCHQVV